VLLVVQPKVLPKLPPAALLLPSRGTVVRQVRVGVIVKETWHRLLLLLLFAFSLFFFWFVFFFSGCP
jgi:hypothetical protein